MGTYATTSTLIVCENPWTHESGRHAQRSVRPFLEGLSDLTSTRLIYRTFTSGQELRRLLSIEAVDRSSGRFLVYIASHGNGGRLSVGRHDLRVNLASIATYMHRGIEGIWVGACDLGGAKALEGFLTRGGAIWAGGYACSVDWAPSLLVDLAVLEALLSPRSIPGRASLRRALKQALTSFNPWWRIGWNGNNERVPLARALRVLARDRRQGSRPRDITSELQAALRWDID